MKVDDNNLLRDHEWTGTFYPPGRKDLAFADHLRYSATDGLKLQYAMPMDLADRDTQWNVLHGETSNGTPLTLVGKFSTKNSGYAFRHGQSYWTSSGHPFSYVIVGFHFQDDETFASFEFDVTGLEDFLAQKGQQELARHSKSPIVSAQIESGALDLIHRGEFSPLGQDLRARLYADNEAALDELQAAYEQIRAKHSPFFPYLRKKLGYSFRFKPNAACGVMQALRQADVVAALLSLLRFSPTRLTSFFAVARDDAGHPHAMSVFSYRVDDTAAIELSRADRDYLSLPLNGGDLALGEAVEAWCSTPDRYSSMTSAVQNMSGKITAYEAHAAIVLAATQIEGIAIDDGRTGKEEKYSYPVSRYASVELQAVLAKLFRAAFSMSESLSRHFGMSWLT